MRNTVKLMLLVFALFCCNYSFSRHLISPAPLAGKQSPVQQKTGKVYFIRHTGFEGSAVTFKAVIDKEVVCKLNNKKYSVHDVTTGEHSFSVQFSGKQAEPVTLNIEEGKTYYLYMIIQPGVMKTPLYCIEITENAAKKFLETCEQDTKCD
ncbi:MAG TPA: DUF2846 domain-containing protein [Segetibacter sp.]|jgi:hypothetical protein